MLVQEHAGMVFATAKRVTGDAALAEDVAQETFLELARSSQGTVQSVAAWLHRVAWRKACNALRGESRRRRHEQQVPAAWPSEAGAEATWEELEPQIDAALSDLPEALKELLVAHYLEGCTQQALSERAGVSQSTVSRQLETGIQELRRLLRNRGVLCGTGLAALLSMQSGQAAAPATLGGSLGKLALSGAGSSVVLPAAAFTPAACLAMSATTKVLIAATTAAAAIGLPQILKHRPATPPALHATTARKPARATTAAASDKKPPAAVPHHYRPTAVSAQVQQKVEGILRRHQGMTKEQLKKSRELNLLMERFIAVIGAPEIQEQVMDRISALPIGGGQGMVMMELDTLDDAKGRAWLEAAVADDEKLLQDWVLNTLDGAIFEFALEPGIQRSSNGVSVHAAPAQPAALVEKDE